MQCQQYSASSAVSAVHSTVQSPRQAWHAGLQTHLCMLLTKEEKDKAQRNMEKKVVLIILGQFVKLLRQIVQL